MRTELPKEDYTTILMSLVKFYSQIEWILPQCDQAIIKQAIETIRWYSQFAQKRGDNLDKVILPLFEDL